jgi:multidrug efflux pump subunit AcrB
MTIQTRGELKTAEEFNNLVIRTEGATLVRLRTSDAPRRARKIIAPLRALAASRACFSASSSRRRANTVSVAQGIRAEVKAIKPDVARRLRSVGGLRFERVCGKGHQ